MKATHTGECQICGSRQMLPNGSLSKHGYTVKWGFFNGVCSGSGYLPFEQSKDRIAGAMAAVQCDIDENDARIADLEDLNSEVNAGETALKSVYPYGADGYQWVTVRVIDFRFTKYDSMTCYYASASYETHDRNYKKITKVEKIEAYDAAWKLPSLRHWVHFLNCKYAQHLRKQNASRRSWMKWQQERLANWTVKPLTARV